MEALAPVIALSVLALTIGGTLVLRGPLGKALAERIAGRGRRPEGSQLEELRAELEDLRGQVAEVQERLDFTERLLAQQRDVGRIGKVN